MNILILMGSPRKVSNTAELCKPFMEELKANGASVRYVTLADKEINPCKSGGAALFGVPGIKEEFDDKTIELLSPWLGKEAYMFRSVRQWRKLLGEDADMASAEVYELGCFEAAWQDWLGTDNEFARGDAACWEQIIKPYTNFVGMIVRKR